MKFTFVYVEGNLGCGFESSIGNRNGAMVRKGNGVRCVVGARVGAGVGSEV